jgi:hypothetical protein
LSFGWKTRLISNKEYPEVEIENKVKLEYLVETENEVEMEHPEVEIENEV